MFREDLANLDGNDDNPAYRKAWIRSGSKWFDEGSRPANWDLQMQLKNIDPDWNKR
jgi:hypothetical protein